MSRRNTRSITSVLKQTKPPNARVTKPAKAAKAEVKTILAKENIIVKTETHVESKKEPVAENHEAVVQSSPAVEAQTLQDAVDHLCKVDTRFISLFSRFIPKPWTAEGLTEPKNHFRSLVLGVMSQQVSGAAARSISRKFVGLFSPQSHTNANFDVDIDPEVEDGPGVQVKIEATEAAVPADITDALPANAAPANDSMINAFFPSPEQVANAEVLYLKSAGLSLRKAEYVQGIAKAFVSGDYNDDFFATADDETIKQRLVALRGLGPWSAEMFMMFSLKHWDILSPGDIGIQRGMSYFVGKDPRNKSSQNKNKAQKYMTEAEMLEVTEPWRPYRSIGCWMMWRIDRPDFMNPIKNEDG